MKIRMKLIQLILILAILLVTTAFTLPPVVPEICPLVPSLPYVTVDKVLWDCSIKLPPIQIDVAWNK